jgi:hypothetical protein
MNNFDLNEFDLEENDDLDNLIVSDDDIADIIKNIPKFDIVKLCDTIVCHRYISFNKQIAEACMEELGKRRASGDTFDFESYIEKELSALPKLDNVFSNLKISLDQVMSTISQFSGRIK